MWSISYGEEPLESGETSIARVAADVQSGRTAAGEVLSRCLAAIAHDNPRLNAIVAERGPEARAEAAEIDRASGALPRARPLVGVPFSVKDVIATAQLPTTCGSRVMAGHRPPGDATAVARLRRAGAILVGKTNCPEFAFSIDTSNGLHGRTRNPLGDFTPGGSSGGEAAAIAAGMSLLGVGSDFGGSIRWPAQCVGIAGLRPTAGRIPATGLLPTLDPSEPFGVNTATLQGQVQTIGPMAVRVSDLELALAVMAGSDGVDPFAVDAPLGSMADVQLVSVEIRFGHGVAGQIVEQPVADAVDFAVAALTRAGVRVRPGLPAELDAAVDVYAQLRGADPLEEIARVSRGREDELMPYTKELLNAVRQRPRLDVTVSWDARDRLRATLLRQLTGDRALILPVASRLPMTTAEAQGLGGASQFEAMACSRAVALFGLPALSVPCPPAPDGRPVSVQIVGPPFREDLVLALGRCVERAATERPCEWHGS